MSAFDYLFRQANELDIPFLIRAIAEADKSETGKLSYATLYGVSEEQALENIGVMLEQEIDGCDLSLGAFLIAEKDGLPVATFGSWVEGGNEEEMPSGLLKSNLLGYVYGPEGMQNLAAKSGLLNQLLLPREKGALQFESLYVLPEERGQGLGRKLIAEHIHIRKQQYPDLTKAQVQLFSQNLAARQVYEKSGFAAVQEKTCTDPQLLNFLGMNAKLLMEKDL